MTREEAMEILKDMTEEELILFRDAILERLRNPASAEAPAPADQAVD